MSSTQFVVVMRDQGSVYGPFAFKTDADRFARFVTQEIDPAEVRRLCSPVLELLNWRDHGGRLEPWPPGQINAEQCSPSRPEEGVRIRAGEKMLTRITPRAAFGLAADLINAAIRTEEEPPF